MKRTTISLPEGLAQALEHEASRHGTSSSEVVRSALVDHLGLNRPRDPFAGIGRSGRGKIAANLDDELLAAEAGWIEADALGRG